MPHFHFDVCTNGVIVEDEDGLDLLNAATARLEAVRAAARDRAPRHARAPRAEDSTPPCNAKSPGQRGVLTGPVYDGRVEEIVAALMHRH